MQRPNLRAPARDNNVVSGSHCLVSMRWAVDSWMVPKQRAGRRSAESGQGLPTAARAKTARIAGQSDQVSAIRPGTVVGCGDHRSIPPRTASGVKVDARSERWREHRKKVRAEIVEAAFRAIDRLGPERQLCGRSPRRRVPPNRRSTATSPTNPTCSPQIGERMRDMLWAAVIPASIDIESDSARQVIGRSGRTLRRLVDEHPNVCVSCCRAGSPNSPRPR